MKLHFILRFGILLSFIGIINFLVIYLLDPDPNAFLMIGIHLLIASTLIVFFIRQYVLFEIGEDAFPGFIKYVINFIALLFLSTTIHFTAQYLTYNHLDTDYKYDVEEQYYQKTRTRRIKKGLPLPYPMSNEEIEYNYGFLGLLNYFKTYYVLA
ncbi:MAG: hypothetical protein L3J06_09125 [Cyclobacteriaceae bacterium]|nr:hypothetical protein [Cyclobacteriaceae bacterium]